MISEINIDGIFISPLLLCLALAFPARLLTSRLMEHLGCYRLIAQRPLFDTCLFLILTGVFSLTLKYISVS
ncbi:hypothetical protein Xmau_01049 [Xenorhabdus mauleonii]|uniref:DUF1656 domain-containing protein n=1 Tax=Xenorhabdus mauleonii TaxID=351675 RepID=A0A1I3M4H9_9GAMM|nr:DUF1656 domain-containing protein [Xenorhabdus mauleonii]PHM45399.1 hypothetical protein Xmau_01049 [Xenorhabdus mauleonii]SFI91921.1 Protein of unknown function [Xenorhabdus mauleonii]